MTPTENANGAGQETANEAARQAPAVDLPDEVPEFVGDVLEGISTGVGGLGETISDLASSANPADLAAGAADVAAIIPL